MLIKGIEHEFKNTQTRIASLNQNKLFADATNSLHNQYAMHQTMLAAQGLMTGIDYAEFEEHCRGISIGQLIEDFVELYTHMAKSTISIDTYTYGNVTKYDSIKIASDILTIANGNPLPIPYDPNQGVSFLLLFMTSLIISLSPWCKCVTSDESYVYAPYEDKGVGMDRNMNTDLQILEIIDFTDIKVDALKRKNRLKEKYKSNIIKYKYGNIEYINKNSIPNDNNNGIMKLLYYDNIIDPKSRVIGRMLYNSISNFLWNDLRTQKQLGYAVFPHITELESTLVLGVLIQGHRLTPDQVEGEIDKGLVNALRHLKNIPDSDIIKARDSLSLTLVQPHVTWMDEFYTNFNLIMNRSYCFNDSREQSNRLHKMTPSQIRVYMIDMMCNFIGFKEKQICNQTNIWDVDNNNMSDIFNNNIKQYSLVIKIYGNLVKFPKEEEKDNSVAVARYTLYPIKNKKIKYYKNGTDNKSYDYRVDAYIPTSKFITSIPPINKNYKNYKKMEIYTDKLEFISYKEGELDLNTLPQYDEEYIQSSQGKDDYDFMRKEKERRIRMRKNKNKSKKTILNIDLNSFKRYLRQWRTIKRNSNKSLSRKRNKRFFNNENKIIYNNTKVRIIRDINAFAIAPLVDDSTNPTYPLHYQCLEYTQV
eukprot:GHVR01083578.1.p1 GENE.GHVR01083578.1~~GHVR01083578.1.p1  ORF type:complete len:669 (-),score=142.95 GHVR01083578.1:1575-3512(-)